MNTQSAVITLSDGRQLGYAEYGALDGTPVLYFHGNPGSRLEGALIAPYAPSARIISIDRPGMGLSTFQPGRRFLDWPKDVLELVDRLKIQQFRIIGISGGGPYVLACAREIPRSRLLAASIIAGAYPLELGTEGMLLPLRVVMYIAGSWMSPILKPLMNWEIGNLARDADPEALEKQFMKIMSSRPEKDRKCLENDWIRSNLIKTTREAFVQEGGGAAYDLQMVARKWDFELESIDFDGLVC